MTAKHHEKNGKHTRNGHATRRPPFDDAPIPSVSDGPPAPPASPPPPDSGRDASGRFVKGNRGGPGNPFTRRLGTMRRAFLDAITPADVQGVAVKLLELARRGDVAAAALFLSYALGKPAKVVNPDTLDLGEWQLAAAAPTAVEVATAVTGTVAPGQAAAVLGCVLDVLASEGDTLDVLIGRLKGAAGSSTDDDVRQARQRAAGARPKIE
jgi:hypothetical protein